MTASRVREALAALGERPFRASQVFRWLHQRGARAFDEMTDLPLALRAKLAERHPIAALVESRRLQAADGTVKFQFDTADRRAIEAVYMPEEGRRTLCVSTQAGCAMRCAFCMTGTLGLQRNLTAGEIVAQVYEVNRRLIEAGLPGPRPLTNLVFMGMGEPLHNDDNLLVALELLQHEEGLRFSHRHITVSTSGLVPKMERFGRESQAKLAISLNATTDETRDRLMPVNRRWNLEALLAACRAFPARQGRKLTFEYVLLGGVNDTPEDAARLVKMLRGMDAKVNLIPWNAGSGLPFEPPAEGCAEAMRDRLVAQGIPAMVRKSRGREIAAACGQLAGSRGAES